VRQASRGHSGAGLAECLRARRAEIEQATLTRIHAVSELPRSGGPEYAEGLRAAVTAAIDYGLAGIERGEQSAPPIPDVLLSQARLAARSGVSLDTVLRRYFAGHALLGDFLIEEAERGEQPQGPALKCLSRSLAAISDRLLAAVSKAYTEEAERHPEGTEQRRSERVERLLAGEPLDASDLDYDFDGHHLAAIAAGQGAQEAIRELAKALDCRLLLVSRREGTAWAWLGARRSVDHDELWLHVSSRWTPQIALALGEPARGLGGWRFTHQQARAALPIALRGPQPFVRYADVALLASILQDDVLSTSLRQLYLEPLRRERDGGGVARETLRAYFAAGRNVSSAAAALEVKRHTVTNRLRAIEATIGRPLGDCAAELEAALRVEDLGPELRREPVSSTWTAPGATPGHIGPLLHRAGCGG
jgi:hypothetical protein